MEGHLRDMEKQVNVLKAVIKTQDNILINLCNRIGGCEIMAGIFCNSYTIDALQALDPFMSIPRKLSLTEDTRDSVNSLHSVSSSLFTCCLDGSVLPKGARKRALTSFSDDSVPTKKRRPNQKPCTFSGGCEKLAHGPDYMFCLRHGGGYRCQVLGCPRSAYSTKYCSRHGGGPRCQYPSCTKGAISNSTYCRRHGGGPRCQHPNCIEGARVGYQYCLSHGGYNPCAFPACPCPSLHTSAFCRQHNSYQRKVIMDPHQEIFQGRAKLEEISGE